MIETFKPQDNLEKNSKNCIIDRMICQEAYVCIFNKMTKP